MLERTHVPRTIKQCNDHWSTDSELISNDCLQNIYLACGKKKNGKGANQYLTRSPNLQTSFVFISLLVGDAFDSVPTNIKLPGMSIFQNQKSSSDNKGDMTFKKLVRSLSGAKIQLWNSYPIVVDQLKRQILTNFGFAYIFIHSHHVHKSISKISLMLLMTSILWLNKLQRPGLHLWWLD